MGRPNMDDDNPVPCRMDADTYARLQTRAKSVGQTESEYMVRLLQNDLEGGISDTVWIPDDIVAGIDAIHGPDSAQWEAAGILRDYLALNPHQREAVAKMVAGATTPPIYPQADSAPEPKPQPKGGVLARLRRR